MAPHCCALFLLNLKPMGFSASFDQFGLEVGYVWLLGTIGAEEDDLSPTVVARHFWDDRCITKKCCPKNAKMTKSRLRNIVDFENMSPKSTCLCEQHVCCGLTSADMLTEMR